MARLLVTGSEGQLGKCFKWVAKEFPQHQLFFVSQAEVDIMQPQTILEHYNKLPFDILLNCAAYTKVDLAETEVKQAQQVNWKGVENLVSFAETKKLKLIHFSTDIIFDGTHEKDYNETDTPHPLNAYGKTKLAGEIALKKAKCPHTTFRTSWLFSHFGKNFVKSIFKASQAKNTLQVVNDLWGKPTYGLDLVRAVLSNIDHPDLFQYDTYHYAQGPKTSWYKLADTVVNLMGGSCSVNPIPSSKYPTVAKRPFHAVLDTKRIEKTLALTIRGWEAALTDCLTNMETNE